MSLRTINDEGVFLGSTSKGQSALGGRRNRVEWLALSAFIAAALLTIIFAGGDIVSMWPAVVLVGLGYGLTTPVSVLGSRGQQSLGVWLAVRLRHALERHSGGAVFVPRWVAGADLLKAAKSPGRWWTKVGRSRRRQVRHEGRPTDLPTPIGRVRPIRLPMSDGSELVFLRHTNPRQTPYLSVVLEMAGERTGVTDSQRVWSGHANWSRFLAALADRDASFVTRVQQVARVVPHDASDHIAWVSDRTPPEVHQLVRDSYVDLLDRIDDQAIQHRWWLALAMPMTTAWNEAARHLGKGDRGHALLALQEVRTAIEFALDSGFHLRPLSEARLAGVVRALQDPDAPIDDLRLREAGHERGQGELLDWLRAWQPWDARPRDHVLVTGRHREWFTRTAVVPASAIQATELPADFLRPLLVDVSPQVIRTISTVQELIPSDRARTIAINGFAQKGAQRRAAQRRTTDGSENTAHDAAGRVVRDVAKGNHNAGIGWLLTVTFQAPSMADLESATRAMQSAASRAQINSLRFVNGRQDLGLAVSLPFVRGLTKLRRFGL